MPEFAEDLGAGHRGAAYGVLLFATAAGAVLGGLRIGSGLTVGLAGAAIGLHWSLALSSAALICGARVTAAYARGGRLPPRVPGDSPPDPSSEPTHYTINVQRRRTSRWHVRRYRQTTTGWAV
ncbi:hypothetical protein [Micromonospora matsumotoense]|uniref:hypothetical protein n=1 Tax=Micromonospora matsumotoense TaxID=121616 RepID=UPI0033CBCF2D